VSSTRPLAASAFTWWLGMVIILYNLVQASQVLSASVVSVAWPRCGEVWHHTRAGGFTCVGCTQPPIADDSLCFCCELCKFSRAPHPELDGPQHIRWSAPEFIQRYMIVVCRLGCSWFNVRGSMGPDLVSASGVYTIY
jgi:hypothetical protein